MYVRKKREREKGHRETSLCGREKIYKESMKVCKKEEREREKRQSENASLGEENREREEEGDKERDREKNRLRENTGP